MRRSLVLLGLCACLVDPSGWEERREELACGPSGVPGQPEVPADGVDGDCDGKELCFEDGDGDGFGLSTTRPGPLACDEPGLAAVAGDCDDGRVAVSPGADEVLCNQVDDDCDPTTADAGTEVPGDGVDGDCDGLEICFEDLDGDGYGAGAGGPSLDLTCTTEGLSPTSDDCDDADDGLHPGIPEVCNGVDDDCDGLVDDDDPSVDPATQHEVPADADGDGYGHPTDSELGCDGPPGDNRLDCDDTDPLATVEQDWYDDADGDLSGAGAARAHQCENPGGGLAPEANGVDCEPRDPAIYPLRPEDCGDGEDQNCDDRIDCADVDCAGLEVCKPPCADLAWAPAALPATITGSTDGAGNDDVGSCGGGRAEDFAYWFTSPVTGRVIFDTVSSRLDTVLYARDACGGVVLACNDDAAGLISAIPLDLTAGVPVLVVVDGYGTQRGDFQLRAQLQ